MNNEFKRHPWVPKHITNNEIKYFIDPISLNKISYENQKFLVKFKRNAKMSNYKGNGKLYDARQLAKLYDYTDKTKKPGQKKPVNQVTLPLSRIPITTNMKTYIMMRKAYAKLLRNNSNTNDIMGHNDKWFE